MEKSSHSQGSASSFEADSQDRHLQSKLRAISMTDSARAGTTVLALLMGLTILGISANTLRVYEETHVSREFMLPLWPDDFNIRPTLALVVGSAIVLVANAVGIIFNHIGNLRAKSAAAHTSATFLAPLAGLAGALVAVAFYYVADRSEATDTFVSWTCRWRDVPMTQAPRWGDLCRQSLAGLYLAVALIPVEVVALALAAFQTKVERYTDRYLGARKTPVLP